MSIWADDCQTAQEVRVRAKNALRRRRELFNPSPRLVEPPAAPAPVARIEPPPPPAPESDITAAQPLMVRPVLETAARYFGISVASILTDRRTWPLVRQRQIAMFVAWEATGRSYPAVGRAFSRDHTTIIHGTRVIRQCLDAGDPETGEAVMAIMEMLGKRFVWDMPINWPKTQLTRPALKPDWSEAEIHAMVMEYGKTQHSARNLADKLGRTVSAIYTKARKLGLQSIKARSLKVRP